MTTLHQNILIASRRGARQQGSTLIEVLVAILIFSFGLLGLVGLHARATQFATGAEDTNRAALLASELAVTMITSQTIAPASGVISAWQARVADVANGGLPNGIGTTTITGSVATITVTWQPPSAVGTAFNSTNQYMTQVVIP